MDRNSATKPEVTQSTLEQTRVLNHPTCVVCGRHGGLALQFASNPDGSVQAEFACSRAYEGYKDVMHGGVVSSLLDGAMTNCLFAHGIVAVTAELVVRFRHPVAVDVSVSVIGRIVSLTPPLHVMEAQVIQGGVVMAVAKAKFMEMNRCLA